MLNHSLHHKYLFRKSSFPSLIKKREFVRTFVMIMIFKNGQDYQRYDFRFETVALTACLFYRY
jgi:hypothetical protein